LLAWFATMMTVFFMDQPSPASLSSKPGAKPSLAHQHQPGRAPVGRHRKTRLASNDA